jgi:hypothetical protein
MLSSRPNKKRREKHENYTRAASSSFLQLKLLTQINKNRLYDDGRRKKKKKMYIRNTSWLERRDWRPGKRLAYFDGCVV